MLYFQTYESDKESLVEIPGTSRDKRFFMLYTANKSVSGFLAGYLYRHSIEQWRGKTAYRKNPEGGNETCSGTDGVFTPLLYQLTAHCMY